MKSPREILLERHQSAALKLDAIRQSAVAAVCDRRPAVDDADKRRSQTAATMIWHVFWRELILPSRRIWAGLAAVWILLLVTNVSLRDRSPGAAMMSASGPEMILSFRQQERLVNELIGPDETRVAEPVKTLLPQPSSERRFDFLTV